MGAIAYKGNIYGGATTLGELTNVNVNEPSDGQILKYDEENEQWINGDINLEGVQTVTGNPITLTDGSETYADELVIDLEPIQSGSGTPSPSNIRAIQGYDIVSVDRCGKNLLENTASDTVSSGITWTINDDGSVIADGTVTGNTSQKSIYINTTKVYGDLRVSCNMPNRPGNVNAYVWDYTTEARAKQWDGVTNSETMYDQSFKEVKIIKGHTVAINIRVQTQGTVVSNQKFYPMICTADETDTVFEPYNGTSLTVPLGQTVYGATVDVANGVMVIDRGYADLGDLTWEASSTAHCFYASTNKTTLPFNTTDAELVCSRYQYDGMYRVAPFYGESGTIRVYLPTSTQTIRELYVCDDNFTTISDFITAMSGVQLVYKLDTPIIIPLESQQLKLLKGKNYISSNGTTIHLTYQPDNAVGDAVSEAEKYADRIKLNPVTILDDVAVSGSSTQYTIPDISQFTMVQFVLTTCPAAGVAYIRDTKTIPVSVLLHNISAYTYNHIITLLATDPSTANAWTECRIEMNSTTQISVRSDSGASGTESPRLSIIAW